MRQTKKARRSSIKEFYRTFIRNDWTREKCSILCQKLHTCLKNDKNPNHTYIVISMNDHLLYVFMSIYISIISMWDIFLLFKIFLIYIYVYKGDVLFHFYYSRSYWYSNAKFPSRFSSHFSFSSKIIHLFVPSHQ